MAVQFVSTPLHLLGLDLYNRKDATPSMRAAYVISRRCFSVPCFSGLD
jgi:hypothetical protein